VTFGDFLIVLYVALVIVFVAWQWSRAAAPKQMRAPQEPAEPGEEPVKRAA
jgi:hypothetical protein